MGDMRSGGRCRKSCAACIGKKIQNFYRASRVSDLFRKPIPVCRLFGKESGMFKTKWFQIKCKRSIVNLPLLRQTEKFPFPAAFFTAVVMAVHLFPSFMILFRVPDYLRIGANKKIISPSFQFFSVRTIYNFIIFPVVCNPHNNILSPYSVCEYSYSLPQACTTGKHKTI